MNETRQAGGRLQQRLIALGLGVLALVVVCIVTFFISGDHRVVYGLGAALLFCLAVWLGRTGKPDWISIVLLLCPMLVGFGFLLLSFFPRLWPNLLLWASTALIGLLVARAGRSRNWLAGFGLAVPLIAISAWYCASYLPKLVASDADHFSNVPAPVFSLHPVSSGSVPISVESGKILVVDFFATWCAPCKAELPELEGAMADLSANPDIRFVLVASNMGGDTPERFLEFAQNHKVSLPLAFDPDGKAHASLGLAGVPAIAVIDRAGRVRLTRQGYNRAETDFRRDLVRFLKSL